MSDLPVYMVVNITIVDAKTYRTYEKGFFPFLKKYGGEFVTYDDAPETFEGTALAGRVIIFKFPTEALAKAWYADADYQALSEHRRAGTSMSLLTMVRSVPPKG